MCFRFQFSCREWCWPLMPFSFMNLSRYQLEEDFAPEFMEFLKHVTRCQMVKVLVDSWAWLVMTPH